MPTSPNPLLAQLPAGADADYSYWRAALNAEGAARSGQPQAFGPAQTVAVGESEGPTQRGLNDVPATADEVAGLGTGAGEDPAAAVAGVLPGTFLNQSEENGSRPTATDTGLTAGSSIFAIEEIGEAGNPHGNAGSGTGDYDWYALSVPAAGTVVDVDVTTLLAFSTDTELDPVVAVYNGAGTRVAENDDGTERGFDSMLSYSAPAAGTYYVVVRGFGSGWQGDVDDPTSGAGSGSNSEGVYVLEVALDTVVDRDVYALDLAAGDVLGVALDGANLITVLRSDGTVATDSLFSNAAIYPTGSPLPAGAFSDLSYVAEAAGTYYVQVRAGQGAYDLTLGAFRPGLQTQAIGATQVLFLDFHGASIDTTIFGGPAGGQPRSLSPLSSFLAGWGLPDSAEDDVIDAVVAAVQETLAADLRADGRNGDRDASGVHGQFDVEIHNSRDHPDPFGGPNVSRVIVGGTIAQSGIPTIGIAESIDPGNYASGESALVLLDLLSADASDPNSLNSIPRGGGATIIDVIGAGVGNITAHEAGHFLGGWHQDQFNSQPRIMDQGGNLPGALGVGADGTFGTADDVDVDHGSDDFVPNEAFFGVEDTAAITAFALSTGAAPTLPGAPPAPSATARDASAVVSFAAPADDGGSPVTGYRVRTFAGSSLLSTTAAASSPVTVSGLDNGTSYRFTVAAVNAVGQGPPSPQSAAVVPRTVPGAPRNVRATAGDGQAQVSFGPPADDGGQPVTAYTVRAYDGDTVVATVAAAASPVTVSALDNGATYTFTVSATNVAGEGPESARSEPLTLGSLPGVPRNVSAAPGQGALEVDFDAPADDGGLDIESYRVRAYDGEGALAATATGAGGPITVDGLTDRTVYTVTVAAVNALGEGPESPPSDPVAPLGVAGGITRLDAGSPDVIAVAVDVCSYLLPLPGTADRVLLARSDVFADALAGAPLAGDEVCILYTAGGDAAPLDQTTRAEIDRVLLPGGTVQIMGGEVAVSRMVSDELTAAGYTVDRFSGPTRFETAVEIAGAVQEANPGNTEALLAYGLNWPDAITGGAFGAANGRPILLTPTASLHPAAAAAFSQLGLTSTAVLGGRAVLSDTAMAAAPNPRRVAGPNRMGTAVAVATDLWSSVPASNTRFVFANLERADAWPLALAAAPLSAQVGAPQLGIGTAFYPDETNAYLESLTFTHPGAGIIIGGEDFVTNAFEQEIITDLQP